MRLERRGDRVLGSVSQDGKEWHRLTPIDRDGRELPVEPFGSELYYYWTCRREGYPWPKPASQDEA